MCGFFFFSLFNFQKGQDVGAEKDAITSLRAPTHYGRPNWDRVFPSISEKHPETDVGVVSLFFLLSFGLIILNDLFSKKNFKFFCGPPALSKILHQMSNKYSEPKGTRFFFGKGKAVPPPHAPSLIIELFIIFYFREFLEISFWVLLLVI